MSFLHLYIIIIGSEKKNVLHFMYALQKDKS